MNSMKLHSESLHTQSSTSTTSELDRNNKPAEVIVRICDDTYLQRKHKNPCICFKFSR